MIQSVALDAVSACRDEAVSLFEKHSDGSSLVDYTLKQLFSYQSDRSQTISFLVSTNYWWDAEILMRSFYETHAKIWFICQTKDQERQGLAEEFWGAFSELHARRTAMQAKVGADFLRNIQELKMPQFMKH